MLQVLFSIGLRDIMRAHLKHWEKEQKPLISTPEFFTIVPQKENLPF